MLLSKFVIRFLVFMQEKEVFGLEFPQTNESFMQIIWCLKFKKPTQRHSEELDTSKNGPLPDLIQVANLVHTSKISPMLLKIPHIFVFWGNKQHALELSYSQTG